MPINGDSHILIFPYPAQGHMLSLLDLTNQLANIYNGLLITIIITPKNLPTISTLLSAHPTTITALVLPLPPHPAIPPGVENVKDLPNADGFKAMMKTLADLHNPIVDWFHNHPSPPVAIISDMFLGWTHHLAGELGIRRYVFSPSGAFALSVIYSLWRHLPKRKLLEEDENEVVSFPNIPNSPKYPWWQLSPLYRCYKKGDPTTEFIKDGLVANMVSWGVVINSFTELERVYIDHLKDEVGHDRVFPVGPLHPQNNNKNKNNKTIERGGPVSNHVLPWLDTCPPQSVVYVCFGSQAVLTNDQMEVVARGLECSQVRFVWSIKEPTVGHAAGKYGKIPLGFEDRVAGWGLVVRGWVPQVAILSHDSVGSFLTHCGWNSIMEAVVAEVLMLTWPMSADQYSNATLVHELKVGMRACEGAETVPDSVELGELLRKSVSPETRVSRERVKEFGKAAKEAIIGEKGSSVKELDRFVASLSHLK